MLFIKRKIGESFRINEDVQITVVNVQGKTVTLGAVYPKGNEIWREEVFQRIQKEKENGESDYSEQSDDLEKVAS